MLRFDFVTLFPEMVLGATRYSILGRAREAGAVSFGTANPRDFASDRHRSVDDRPFGGGPGMIMMPETIAAAVRSLEPDRKDAIVLLDARGPLFAQADARDLAEKSRIILICGHYGGVDDRVRQSFATHIFSVGDFVLTGGELPALVVTDAIVRLLPGVLGSEESAALDTHSQGILSAPQFTQPETFEGLRVPEVLRCGNHAAAARWKRSEALKLTRRMRPDLFWRASLEKADVDMLSS